MRIRSVTIMIDPARNDHSIHAAAKVGLAAKKALEASGLEVQTMRLATTPFASWSQVDNQMPERIASFEQQVFEEQFNYASIGPLASSDHAFSKYIPEILGRTSSIFVTMHLLNQDGYPYLPAINACANIIAANSRITPDGFTNLRFAALAGVRPGSPFFPAAYNHAGDFKVSIAVESADLAIEVFEHSNDLHQAASELVKRINAECERIQYAISQFLPAGQPTSLIDFTLAPHPDENRSIGTALERLGLPAAGLAGTLTAAAYLMSILDQANPYRTGFNGLMLPVLEDSILAKRASDGHLSIQNLLLYSAVCGTGLDCLPLPGDITPDEITPILMDTASLSSRLKKQLTARLMPVPGKQIHELTTYGFEYFANSRVMSPDSAVLMGLLKNGETIPIRPLKQIDQRVIE